MNQRLNAQLGDHADKVLELALLALTAIKAKLDAGMSADEKMHTICTMVSGFLNSEGHGPYHREVQAVLRKSAKTWPNYSENPTCPVPAPSDFSYEESELPPEEKIYERVFHGHLYEGSFWGQETEYGRLRADLLNHQIQVLSEELNYRSVTRFT